MPIFLRWAANSREWRIQTAKNQMVKYEDQGARSLGVGGAGQGPILLEGRPWQTQENLCPGEPALRVWSLLLMEPGAGAPMGVQS